MVQQNQFVEYGEHQKFQYGTSFDAIRDVIAQGKVCLLKQHPEVGYCFYLTCPLST